MSKYINLLLKGQTYRQQEKIFEKIRTASFVIGFICITSLAVVFLLKTVKEVERARLLSQKERLLSELLNKRDIEKKVIYFNDKSVEFENILAKDVNFLPYYRLLVNYLPISTGSAEIESMKYENEKNVSFTLNFSDYDVFYDSLNNLEDLAFLKIFERLSLEEFSITGESTNNYKVSFSGKFKPVDQIP